MKIRTIIDNIVGRYEVQVDTYGFTAHEEEQMRDFGEPLVEVGGTFTGSASRPDETNTTVTIEGDGSGATAVPVIVDGIITAINISNMGSGYVTATVTIEGDGTGAAASVTTIGEGGTVEVIEVSNGGTDYNVVPVAVTFELPTATRRLRADFPVKQVFDLEDSSESDVMAKVWGDTIVSRATAAKNQLLSRTSPFEGETVTTV